MSVLIFTLGTHASASTWVFNVCRKIMSLRRPDCISFFADSGEETLRRAGADINDMVVKGHSLDQTMIALLAMSDAKVIVTSRDPRDILVSQHERFGLDHRVSMRLLSLSLASIASVPERVATLALRYEDGFFDRIETVLQIATFLELRITNSEAETIAGELRPDRVQALIDHWSAGRGDLVPVASWDETTHWHPRHLGDRQSGKWVDRLPADVQDAACEALAPLDVGSDWRAAEIRWAPLLYSTDLEDGTSPSTSVSLSGVGSSRCWGPYLHLPSGRWRIKPLFLNRAQEKLTVCADCFSLYRSRGVIELRTITLSPGSANDVTMDIDVLSHLESIETRLTVLPARPESCVEMLGVALRYLGPCDAAPVRATSVSD